MMKTNSLKKKIVLYFIILVIAIFIILWLLQVIFLQSMYSFMIESEVAKVGNTIKENIENEDKLNEISFKNSFNIMVVSDTGEMYYGINSEKRPFYIDLNQAKYNLNHSSADYATYSIKIDKMKSGIVVYVTKVDNKYLIVSTNLEPISATSRVISTQLIYITIITLTLSIIISTIISKKIARPIESITEKAREFGNGNYKVEFDSNTEYSEINELAETLNYSAKEMERTDRLRKELIANVSHDIKTPLTIIKAYSEMIKDLSGDVKEKREEHLDIIINQADLLTKLTDDMMDLSKLETGTATLEAKEYDLKLQIDSVVKGFRAFTDIEFKSSFDENIDSFIVLADEIKINQVINNLVSNAINYVGEDKTVYINVKNKDENYLRVEVKDNGKGMEDTSHIFDRYYKSNDKFRKSGYGTGLGLTIVKNILELHGLEYGVESKLGVGTTFYFDIKKNKIN